MAFGRSSQCRDSTPILGGSSPNLTPHSPLITRPTYHLNSRPHSPFPLSHSPFPLNNSLIPYVISPFPYVTSHSPHVNSTYTRPFPCPLPLQPLRDYFSLHTILTYLHSYLRNSPSILVCNSLTTHASPTPPNP
jgi:hypothetical protein